MQIRRPAPTVQLGLGLAVHRYGVGANSTLLPHPASLAVSKLKETAVESTFETIRNFR